MPPRYSCCKNCKAVVHYKNMYSHSQRCKIANMKFPTNFAITQETSGSQGQELRAKNRVLANTIAHLLRTGSDKVRRYPPGAGELPPLLVPKFDCVSHEGSVVSQ